MWQIVCIGPGPLGRVRRVVDRGPLHADKSRAQWIARYLRETGLYESVTVVSGAMKRNTLTAQDEAIAGALPAAGLG